MTELCRNTALFSGDVAVVQGESGIPDLPYLAITLLKLIFTRSELHGGTKLALLQFAESQPILVILESSRHGVLLK